MPSLNHIHQYVRYSKRGGRTLKDRVFRCDDPGCSHYAPAELVIGKFSRCTLCGGQFKLDADAARRARPRCPNCTVHKSESPADLVPAHVKKAMDAIDPIRSATLTDRNRIVVGLAMSLYDRLEDWLADSKSHSAGSC